MDTDYSFCIRAGDIIVLVGNYPVKADILIISPYHSVEEMQSILQTVRPDRVVPIHWDNFLQPLSRPLQPMLVTPWQGWGGWPPVRRLNLQEYSRRIEMIHPKTQVILPEIFKEIAYGSH
jgi:L-ascorbate metabolism protein UlaG (beta-lactamase superfamily)